MRPLPSARVRASGGTIEAWWPEVLGFLQTHATNAGTEATNWTVKTAARTAYGFRKLEDQRRRVRPTITPPVPVEGAFPSKLEEPLRSTSMSWLVTGGAGYIGAHVVRALVEDGQQVVVIDDLSTGDRARVDSAAAFEQGSLLDRAMLRRVMRKHAVAGVVHIAAKKRVTESIADPLMYYRENVEGLIALLDSCRAQGVGQFVFSSSAATCGVPDVKRVTEGMVGRPLSPYGESKLMGEWMLSACERAYGMRTMSLRCFNVAGAAADALGDPNIDNLIPMVFDRLERGERPRVFGADYDTLDGTCVRDFVHVADIADAHQAAAKALEAGATGATYNIGRGEGSSVLQVLKVVGEVTGLDATPDIVDRRPGDPALVVADVGRIRQGLGFVAARDLRDIISSAWSAWRAARR